MTVFVYSALLHRSSTILHHLIYIYYISWYSILHHKIYWLDHGCSGQALISCRQLRDIQTELIG